MREYRYVFTWVKDGKVVVKHIYAPHADNAKEQLQKAFGVNADSPNIAMKRTRA